MLIGKLFIPLSTPGLAALGLGLTGVAKGTYNAVEVVAIVAGLIVVAIAGVFTIRSNVAKIWREQAEGEKAAKLELQEKVSDLLQANAAIVAQMKVDHAHGLAALQLTIEEQKAELQRLHSELDAATKRTDLTPCMDLLRHLVDLVSASGHIEITGAAGGPVQVEAAT